MLLWARNDMVSNFTDVDRSGDPDAYIGYLDRACTMGSIQAYKSRAFELLRLQAGARVLDLGCGTGDDVRTLARMVAPGGVAVGVDASQEMVREARARGGVDSAQVEFHAGDAHRLQFADDTFDACRADRVVQHLQDPPSAIAELARVARRGGRVVVTDSDWDTLVIDSANRELTRRIQMARFDRIPQRWIGRQLVRLFMDAGLREIEVVPTNLVSRDLDNAEQLYSLQWEARQLQQAGELTAAEVDAWVQGLESASAAGHFFSSATMFTVAGQKH